MHCFVYFGKMASNELEAIKYSKGPGFRFSKVPVTLRARNQIFKSKYKE